MLGADFTEQDLICCGHCAGADDDCPHCEGVGFVLTNALPKHWTAAEREEYTRRRDRVLARRGLPPLG